jgi:methyltransferase (TIGR00027 family)
VVRLLRDGLLLASNELPNLAYQCKVNGRPSFLKGEWETLMRAGEASRTARQNALFRALEARRAAPARVADDPMAVQFLSPEFRLLAELARVPPLRRLIEGVIDNRWPCARGGVVARTRLIDETVVAELPRVRQALILGAGFDTRAYRLGGMKTVRVFEVDHPATQAAKQHVLPPNGLLTAHVTFVPVVFGMDDPARQLSTAGFDPDARTLVLWEGVTNYLDSESVDTTFGFLKSALGSGSPVIFTYVDRAMLDGSVRFPGAETTMRAVGRVGEPFTFGFAPDEVPAYLAERGFELMWDVAVSDAAQRFYPPESCPTVPAYYHVVASRRT